MGKISWFSACYGAIGIPNRVQRIERLLCRYIEQPSQLRNRIAHGQWDNALNSDGTDRNAALSDRLGDLDFLEVERLRAGCTALAMVVESLVESPNKASTPITTRFSPVMKSSSAKWVATPLQIILKS